jgi:phage terminase small subunit
MHEAGGLVREHGLTYRDDKGIFHPNPAAVIERDSRLALVRCLRELNLDASAVESSARPPLIAGGNRYGRTG